MIRLSDLSRPLSAALLALLIFSSGLFGQTEDEVLTVDSSTVLLNATIIDNSGKSVTGLKREQFSVFENGVQQQISYFSAAETPFAAVILIDTSGSMESRISIARAAAINFLTGLRANDSAAIYRFSSKVELIQEFSASQDINESIFEIRADGMTALNDSIFRAAEELKKRPEKRRAIIVLSDGEDTSSGKSADKALKTALDAGGADLHHRYVVDGLEHETAGTKSGSAQKFCGKERREIRRDAGWRRPEASLQRHRR